MNRGGEVGLRVTIIIIRGSKWTISGGEIGQLQKSVISFFFFCSKKDSVLTRGFRGPCRNRAPFTAPASRGDDEAAPRRTVTVAIGAGYLSQMSVN